MTAKLFKSLAIAAAALMLAACGSDENEVKKLITFHIGSSVTNAAAQTRQQVYMPASGYSVYINTVEFMYSGDLEHVDAAKFKQPDGSMMEGFVFSCNERGKRRLFMSSASNMNNFVVVLYDGKPIGLRKIDTAMQNGIVSVAAELPPEKDFVKLAEEMNKSIATINKIKAQEVFN